MLKLATILAAVLAPLAAEAASSSPIIAIGSCPYTIAQPGRYKLTQDLICPADSDGITITADFVSLNLGGHTLTSGARPGPIGIKAQGTADDPIIGLQVQIGAIRNFKRNLFVQFAPGALINRVTVVGARTAGLSVAESPGTRISVVTARDNAIGIDMFNVLGAQVDGNFAINNVIGLTTAGCDGCALTGNRATGNTRNGIEIRSARGARIVGNKVSGNNPDLADNSGGCLNIWRLNRFVTDDEGDGPGKGCIQ